MAARLFSRELKPKGEHVSTAQDKPFKSRAVEALLQALREELNHPCFSDVVVVVQDKEFRGHKFILSAMSDFFKALFDSGMKETLEGRVTVGGISPHIYKLLVSWMYCGEPILTENNVIDVMMAASQLQIKSLLEEGEEFLQETVSVDNCARYFNLSLLCHLPGLNEAAWNVLVNKFDTVSLSELNELTLEDFRRLVHDPKLVTVSEDVVIGTILRWVRLSPPTCDNDERAPDSRCSDLAALIKCSRYLLMSTSFFWKIFCVDPLIQADPSCGTVVDEVLRYKTQLDTHQYHCPRAALERHSSTHRDVILRATDKKFLVSSNEQSPAATDQYFELSATADVIRGLAYHKQVVYVVTHGGNRAAPYYTNSECGESFIFLPSQWPATVALLPIDDALMAVHTKDYRNYTMRSMDLNRPTPGKWTYVGSLDERRMEPICVSNIGSTIVIFWKHPDGACIETYDILSGKSVILPDKLSVADSLVCFKRQDEVFVLQGDGWLKQLQTVAEAPFVTLRDVKQLWVGKYILKGALLIADCLHIFGDETLKHIDWYSPNSVEDVFTKVQTSRTTDNLIGCIHAVIRR